MKIESVTLADGSRLFLRDPEWRGDFLCGVECNEQGVAARMGCTEAPELMIRRDRLVAGAEVTLGVG